MSAFQQALAASSSEPSGSSLSIRGTATGSASARGLGTALRAAGIGKDAHGMEVDGGAGRSQRATGKRASLRSGGPLDQTGRHRGPSTPYAKPNVGRPPPGRPEPIAVPGGRPTRPKLPLNPKLRRNPEGTPPFLTHKREETIDAQRVARGKLQEKLGSEDMKAWLRSRVVADGIMNMSKLPDDLWLRGQGVLPPGHENAPPQAGVVFWKLIDSVIQQPSKIPIHTLSLAGNNLTSLNQLSRLPFSLPHLRALDLSNNPIRRVAELDELLAQGEKKGKATVGVGSLKSLIELKLNDCTFREEFLARPNGAETYQHEILRRFPGLLILDGVNLNRVVFGVERKPKIKRSDDERAVLRRTPFTFPVDVQPGFIDNDLVKSFVMSFCAKFFPLFDLDRNQLLPAYAPTATISASVNTLPSRSLLSQEVQRTRNSRPNQVSFAPWTDLPSRNFFRTAASIEQRMRTLKSPANPAELIRWWTKAVPKTKHPLEEADKWCIDAWVLDGEGVNTKLCAMIEGEFQEMPSGSYRSFSRTFILADAPQGSPAQAAGWPATVLSDITTVSSYLSSGAFDDHRSVAVHGVNVQPLRPTTDPTQDALIQRLCRETNMNAQFATMCLAQNRWVFETALKNFEEIKASIPPEAFQ